MTSTTRQAIRPVDAVAGFLAASACFLAGLELFYRPFRLAPVALILLLVATVMSTQYTRLIKVGFLLLGVCFVVGAGLQVYTHHPLF